LIGEIGAEADAFDDMPVTRGQKFLNHWAGERSRVEKALASENFFRIDCVRAHRRNSVDPAPLRNHGTFHRPLDESSGDIRFRRVFASPFPARPTATCPNRREPKSRCMPSRRDRRPSDGLRAISRRRHPLPSVLPSVLPSRSHACTCRWDNARVFVFVSKRKLGREIVRNADRTKKSKVTGRYEAATNGAAVGRQKADNVFGDAKTVEGDVSKEEEEEEKDNSTSGGRTAQKRRSTRRSAPIE
jgi:hypothetical protein